MKIIFMNMHCYLLGEGVGFGVGAGVGFGVGFGVYCCNEKENKN